MLKACQNNDNTLWFKMLSLPHSGNKIFFIDNECFVFLRVFVTSWQILIFDYSRYTSF